MKPTQVLAFNNSAFNGRLARRCQPTWEGKTSICSKSKRPHVSLKGFVDDKTRGQFRTAAACPYPFSFCEHVAPSFCEPVIRRQPRLGATQLSAVGAGEGALRKDLPLPSLVGIGVAGQERRPAQTTSVSTRGALEANEEVVVESSVPSVNYDQLERGDHSASSHRQFNILGGQYSCRYPTSGDTRCAT